MQAGTWEIFVIRLHQSCVLLYEFCIVVLQVVLCNLNLVEILSKSTKAAKITLLYRINCSVLKGFPALEAKIPYLRASMHEGRDGVNWQLTYGQNFNWQLTNRWKSNWQLTFVVGFLHMSHIGYMILDTQLDRQTYAMAVTAGILKVVVSSYWIDSETVLSVTEATLPVMMQTPHWRWKSTLFHSLV